MVTEGLFDLSRNPQPFIQEKASIQALKKKTLLTCLNKKASREETKLKIEGTGGHRIRVLGKGHFR